MARYTESTLLDKSAAIAIDFVAEVLLPDDMTSDQLSDVGSDYEYRLVIVYSANTINLYSFFLIIVMYR